MDKQEKFWKLFYGDIHFSFIRKVVRVIINLFVMLSPGIVLDITYRFHQSLKYLREWISLLGITYDGAFQILSGHAGMLTTMVSLFLTVNIQIAERSEKKIYGIPRKEMREVEQNQLYISMEQMACVAPLLFLVFLNFGFCFTGYFIFFYCYLFLFSYYYKHRSSYSTDYNQKAVLHKLDGCLSDEECDTEQILQFRLLLENIGRSAEKEGNWLEMETLYYRLLECQNLNNGKKYIMSYYFYSTVFWKYSKNWLISIQMLKRYMRKIDKISTEKDCIPDEDWPVIWGMLKSVCCEADDEHLTVFLQWFLNVQERSSTAFTTEKTLPISVIKEQSGMLLVLFEYRLRQIGIQSVRLEGQLKLVRNYGKVTVQSDDYQCLSQIRKLNQLEPEDTLVIEEVITELEDDYRNHSRKCIITNL